MMSSKRKSGAKKIREKKKMLLLNVSEKCHKINNMFKLRNASSTATKSNTIIVSEFNENIGKFYYWYLLTYLF